MLILGPRTTVESVGDCDVLPMLLERGGGGSTDQTRKHSLPDQSVSQSVSVLGRVGC